MGRAALERSQGPRRGAERGPDVGSDRREPRPRRGRTWLIGRRRTRGAERGVLARAPGERDATPRSAPKGRDVRVRYAPDRKTRLETVRAAVGFSFRTWGIQRDQGQDVALNVVRALRPARRSESRGRRRRRGGRGPREAGGTPGATATRSTDHWGLEPEAQEGGAQVSRRRRARAPTSPKRAYGHKGGNGCTS